MFINYSLYSLDNRDCQAIWGRGVRDAGVYELQLEYSNGTKLAANAWCEFDDQHGWTVIQRRLGKFYLSEPSFVCKYSSYKSLSNIGV